MTRLQAAALALVVLAGPAVAHAEAPRFTDQAVVAYPLDKLATASGREAVKVQVVAAAERYCRANPVGHTVAACRADVAKQLSEGLELKAQAYAKAHPQVEYAER
jgi:UrcA family protein